MASKASESGQGPFTEMVSRFLLLADDEHARAEAIFDQFKTADPDAMATELVALLSSSTDHEYHAMTAVLIHRLIASWPCLNPLTGSTLQSDFLSSLQRKQRSSVCSKIYDAVSELAAVGEWPEMIPFLLFCISSNDSRLQQVTMSIYPCLPYHIAESALVSVLIEWMNTGASEEVRIAAVIEAVRFFQSTPSTSKHYFLHLLTMMLNELTVAEAATWNKVKVVVNGMLQISKGGRMKIERRYLWLEFVVTFIERRKLIVEWMISLPRFLKRLVSAMMTIFVDVVVDDQVEMEEEDLGEASIFGVCQHSWLVKIKLI